MIPRVFHRIWVGGRMPDEMVAYGQTWLRCHPGWTQVLWSDEPQEEQPGVVQTGIPHLFNQSLYDRAEQIAPKNVGQFRADIVRYELLHSVGGVYVDADFECLRSISPLIDGLVGFAAWEADNIWLNNAIMGAEPGLPFFYELMMGLAERVTNNIGRKPNVLSGPQYLTDHYNRMKRAGRWVPTTFPSRFFYPYLWNELGKKGQPFPKAYAVHHWNNRRRESGPALRAR